MSSYLRLPHLHSFWIVLLVCLHLIFPPNSFTEPNTERAAEFELKDMQGQLYRLSDHRGKVVLLNFWASWCPECIEEMPALNSLYEKYKARDLVVLGISADRTKEPAMRVIAKTRVTYPVLLDTSGGVFIRRYTVIGLPTTVVIDRQGFIAERIIGRTDFASSAFVKKMERLVNAGGKR